MSEVCNGGAHQHCTKHVGPPPLPRAVQWLRGTPRPVVQMRKDRHLGVLPPDFVNNSQIFIAQYTVIGCSSAEIDVRGYDRLIAVHIESQSLTCNCTVAKKLSFWFLLPAECDIETLKITTEDLFFKVWAKKVQRENNPK